MRIRWDIGKASAPVCVSGIGRVRGQRRGWWYCKWIPIVLWHPIYRQRNHLGSSITTRGSLLEESLARNIRRRPQSWAPSTVVVHTIQQHLISYLHHTHSKWYVDFTAHSNMPQFTLPPHFKWWYCFSPNPGHLSAAINLTTTLFWRRRCHTLIKRVHPRNMFSLHFWIVPSFLTKNPQRGTLL
jgi:hypothetical protein